MIDQECLMDKIAKWKKDPSTNIFFRPKADSPEDDDDGCEDDDGSDSENNGCG